MRESPANVIANDVKGSFVEEVRGKLKENVNAVIVSVVATVQSTATALFQQHLGIGIFILVVLLACVLVWLSRTRIVYLWRIVAHQLSILIKKRDTARVCGCLTPGNTEKRHEMCVTNATIKCSRCWRDIPPDAGVTFVKPLHPNREPPLGGITINHPVHAWLGCTRDDCAPPAEIIQGTWGRGPAGTMEFLVSHEHLQVTSAHVPGDNVLPFPGSKQDKPEELRLIEGRKSSRQ